MPVKNRRKFYLGILIGSFVLALLTSIIFETPLFGGGIIVGGTLLMIILSKVFKV